MAIKKIFLAVILSCFTIMCFASIKPQKISVILDWFLNPDHAAIIVAQQQGYFKQEGLDVTLIPPADPNDAPKLVAAGQADLGLTDQIQYILQRQQGLPVVQVGTLIGTPMAAVAVLDSSNINKISDLKGKKIGYVGGHFNGILQNMLASGGLTLKDVQLVSVHYSLTQPLLSKQVDAVTGIMRNFELTQMRLLGAKVHAFYPEKSGVPNYSEEIFIANVKNKNNPAIKKFLHAVGKGTVYLQSHVDSTWKVFAKQHPELNNKLNHQAWLDTESKFDRTPWIVNQKQLANVKNFIDKSKGV